jgi:hypothetical protein
LAFGIELPLATAPFHDNFISLLGVKVCHLMCN